MATFEIRKAIYEPPQAGLPYIGLVILPDGSEHMKSAPTREQAQSYIDKLTQNYMARYSSATE